MIFTPKKQYIPEKSGLNSLNAAICQSITQCIIGYRYSKLAHLNGQQISLLAAHPALKQFSSHREMYQQLLEHWLTVTVYFLKQCCVDEHSWKSRRVIYRH